MKDKLVTIYIATHNRHLLLKRCVRSVLKQSHKNIELIIVNDNSTDETSEFLKKLKSDTVKTIENTINLGAPASRNKAILSASGEFVTGIDDDDFMHEDRIKTLLQNYCDDFSFVCSNFYEIDSRTGKTKTKYATKDRVINKNDLLWKNYAGSQVLSRTERMIESGLFDETLDGSQDLDFWIRLTEKYGPALRVGAPLLYQDVTNDRARISSSNKRANATDQFITKHKSSLSQMQLYNKTFQRKRQEGKKLYELSVKELSAAAINKYLR